ncbi:dTDP-4-dehydrorhamnose reductase [Maribacter orientalis]|uniref:dTDP-4-dehydrorhamnose reductase n=1 Tax=Maribacter orientalis TaxID=228957 RepID=A0A1H7TH43_9FLAO|nr:dTDP-4-dehydrorhamnose reductase [Maribacter orientalis]SEL83656.1 dTDP-4-dehydrorhamnose reductase [Maribacter orientalis]
MKRVLVTGANGQLGQCLQKIAPSYQEIEFTFKSSKELDITDTLSIPKAFESQKFDYCINGAAYTNVEQAEKTPELAYAVNAEGVKKIALACKKHDVSLIHISTDYVFDGNKREPYTVDDIPNPINEYGKSKLMGERYIQELMDNYCIIRTSWLYSEFGNNFYKAILDKCKTNKVLRVTDAQKGCPTNANNLALFIMDHITNQKIKSGIYHFTDGIVCTWYDFAKKILFENGYNGKVELVADKNYRTFAKRPKNSTLI